jgi:hypothetical protein
MELNDYWWKKMGEGKDHAANRKKEFKISAANKKDVVIGDLGHTAMEDLQMSQILLIMLSITDDDLLALGKITQVALDALYVPLLLFPMCLFLISVYRSAEERSQLVSRTVEHKIGSEKFELLTPKAQCNACTHIFGGCCCHKDLNVVKYGVLEIARLYLARLDIPPPVLLANKANSAIIELTKHPDPPDSAALQTAVDSSSRGAIKFLSLLGSLLRHKDGERGYQDKCGIFMREQKLELYNLEAPGKFPDV